MDANKRQTNANTKAFANTFANVLLNVKGCFTRGTKIKQNAIFVFFSSPQPLRRPDSRILMFCSCSVHEVTNMNTRFEHVEFMNKRFMSCS